MIYLESKKTPLGTVTVGCTDQGLSFCHLGKSAADRSRDKTTHRSTPLTRKALRQLGEYLDGKRKQFDLPLDPQGTPFQQKVWRQLQRIPFGRTASYGEIAKRVGSPEGARAVGMACNRNPLWIIVPCHRVVGVHGDLTGYGGGLSVKERLLELEGVSLH